MNEEIDIIELLQRVKEGRAPIKIEINGTEYEFQENCSNIVYIYQTEVYSDWLENETITLDTKIKILDKPIIEELEISKDVYGKNPILIRKDGKTNTLRIIDAEIIDKINEIIKRINKENKDDL